MNLLSIGSFKIVVSVKRLQHESLNKGEHQRAWGFNGSSRCVRTRRWKSVNVVNIRVNVGLHHDACKLLDLKTL